MSIYVMLSTFVPVYINQSINRSVKSINHNTFVYRRHMSRTNHWWWMNVHKFSACKLLWGQRSYFVCI